MCVQVRPHPITHGVVIYRPTNFALPLSFYLLHCPPPLVCLACLSRSISQASSVSSCLPISFYLSGLLCFVLPLILPLTPRLTRHTLPPSTKCETTPPPSSTVLSCLSRSISAALRPPLFRLASHSAISTALLAPLVCLALFYLRRL